MPSREAMIATASDYAQEIGWTVTEVEDTGPAVIMMLSAPGASEQMADAPLSTILKALKELGGPEDYSETEVYDLPAEEQATVVGKCVQAQLDAGAEEPTAEIVYPEQAENEEELEAALKLTELHVNVACDGLYDEEWAERSGSARGPGLKELHRALEGEDDMSPDGIPRPEQMLVPAPAEEEVMTAQGLIVARKKGQEPMRFGYRINASVKEALEDAGWEFTQIVKAAKGDKTVAVERSGRVTMTIQNVNGRLLKSAGGLLTVSKGDCSFQAKSVSVEYAKAGWQIQ